jgi:MFS family permease
MPESNANAQPESTYAWLRLLASLAIMAVSGVGMYSSSVALPLIQAEFGLDRSGASFPYTATMIGFGLGGILMGRLQDRFGIMVPVLIGAVGLGLGFTAAAHAGSLWQFALAQGVLIGLLGTAAGFAPLVADTSLWFTRRRGIAVAICASGNYLAGAVWPPILQHLFETVGWRTTFSGVGLFCVATIVPLAFVFRRRPPALAAGASLAQSPKAIDVSRPVMLALLCVAGVACCVAMSMPQVHIVAYCADLGFPAARGAEMLSVMLAAGIVSRLAAAPVPAVRRPGVALRGVGDVRPVPGRHRALLRHHRARVFPGRRGGRQGGFGNHVHPPWHGAGRLDVGRRLRHDGVLPGRLPERHRLEPAQPDDRVLPAAPQPARQGRRSRLACMLLDEAQHLRPQVVHRGVDLQD